MRIMLVISSLGAGGAERVMSLLAGAFAARDHEVWLVTLTKRKDDFFSVGPPVQRIGLGLTGASPNVIRGLWANLQRLRALRRTVATVDPQVVLSFVTSMNVLMILACTRMHVRVIVSERVDPAAHTENRIWTDLRSVLYRRAHALVVQTDSIADWFRQRLGPRARVVVIPNPVVPRSGADSGAGPGRSGRSAGFLLAAGRLAHQKGLDLLIRAFAAATARTRQVQLVIAGDGPEGPFLRDLAAELGVGPQVSFPGQVRDMPGLLKEALAFILPSRYEGFPNVLLEALAAGVPCVAADGPGGTREILGDGAYGLLVPPQDPRALAEAIDLITTDAALRARYSQAGAAAVERYRLDRIVAEWERLFEGAQVALGAVG
jgi:GalNAc-alpha-(1->4)-GalNAc-alpha-(1->3)-diNAcBac-PP-undecaprenol alpha-1,4-N-acetyl-D-galactosaminyltransferase